VNANECIDAELRKLRDCTKLKPKLQW